MPSSTGPRVPSGNQGDVSVPMPQGPFTRRLARRASRRRGAVLLETSLVIMLLLILAFGVMEYGHFVYTRHTLEGAAHRSVREAILPGRTDEEVAAVIAEQMGQHGYEADEYTVTVTWPAEDDPVKNVTVQVQTTWGTVGIRPFGLIDADKQVIATATMRREGRN